MQRHDVNSLPTLTRLGLLSLLVLASCYFARGPFCALRDSRDFAGIYLASTAWVNALDPYDSKSSYRLWVGAKGTPDERPELKVPAVYPITVLTLTSPLTFLRWSYARFIWMLINCLAFYGLLVALIVLAELRFDDWRAISLITACLMLYPVHVAVAMGQPTILAIFCGVLSIWTAASNRYLFSGILLALSLSLKIQLGIPFLCYHVIRRQWVILGFCIGGMMVIITIGILKLGWGNYSWIISWTKRIQEVFTPGGLNDPTIRNPYCFHLLNLQFPLSMMIKNNIVIANWLTMMIVAIEGCILVKHMQVNNNFDMLLSLSTIAVVSLLPMYHRYYDASILVLPLTVFFLLVSPEYRFSRWILIFLSLPFIFPWQDMIATWIKSNYDSPIRISWWWNIIVLPFEVYCILTLSFVLIYLLFVNKRRSGLQT
jgi:hypothetical protein